MGCALRFRYQPRTIVQEAAHARVQRAKRLLLSTDLSIEQIADMVGLTSGRQLARLLRQAGGMSPSRFVASALPRPPPDAPDMDKAKHFLATSGLSVDTIAYICGFGKPYRMVEAFRAAEGIPPRTWRARHRQPPPPPKPPTSRSSSTDRMVNMKSDDQTPCPCMPS